MKIFQIRGTVWDLDMGPEGNWVFYDHINNAICELGPRDTIKFTGNGGHRVYVWIMLPNASGTLTRKLYQLHSIRDRALPLIKQAFPNLTDSIMRCLGTFVCPESCPDCVFD